MKGGTAYDFDGFWIENPKVKTWFRRNEQSLQAAEHLAVAASLERNIPYPTDKLYNAWLLTCLNMDRNTLWGSAGGMVFESEKSWDVQDRLTWVENTCRQLLEQSAAGFLQEGDGAGIFNPLTWERQDPFVLPASAGKLLDGATCEATPEGGMICQRKIRGAAIEGFSLKAGEAAQPRSVPLPERFETADYVLSVRLRQQGREMLGGPANVVWLERPSKEIKDTGDFMQPRPERKVVGSSHGETKVSVREGPLSWLIEAQGELSGAGPIVRRIRLYKNFARVDFETELNDLPNQTVAFAEFPLADDVNEIRRGIPYGFSHGAWAKPNPNLHGWTKGITPAVRWSHYELAAGGGMALFDRGCSGREINGRVPIIYLYNATDKYYGYPNAWLSGKGRHVLQYALVFHAEEWKAARIPHIAWEYNVQPISIPRRTVNSSPSFLTASGNVIVEAVRREGDQIEVRLVECLGLPGTAEVDLRLPHQSAALTDLAGRNAKPLQGKPYRFDVKPQQIVTLHFKTASALPAPEPIMKWDAFVPSGKLAELHAYSDETRTPAQRRMKPITTEAQQNKEDKSR
jgi:alpha-mannosidase